jgi:L-threonylcarbamoyladenylate synthase
VVKELGDRVDLVLDGGPCDAGIESTVVDVRDDPPRVLRPGAIGVGGLRALIPDVAMGPAVAAAGERVSPGMDARHYAPRARMVLAPSLADAVAMARELRSHGASIGPIALVVHEPLGGREGEGLVVRTLPAEPAEYARGLYATLHDLDEAGAAAIVVQAVPGDEAWWAVADRLARGSADRS